MANANQYVTREGQHRDLIERLERYAEHRRDMRARGYDPDFIGVTEAKAVCCANCGTPVPWRTLRGWQD